MNRYALKPCPFCGAEAHLWEWNGGARVDCSRFDGSTHLVGVYGRDKDEAIEEWNKRYDGGEDHDEVV